MEKFFVGSFMAFLMGAPFGIPVSAAACTLGNRRLNGYVLFGMSFFVLILFGLG